MDAVPNIRAGQGDLEQLFLNLAANARDAMPGGGVLSIQTELDGDKLAITIRDTGCGIPPEHISRIQEPFFTTKHNGSGLGLSICRSIIWNVRGEMKIESHPGAGTQIRLLLPTVDDKTAGSTVRVLRAFSALMTKRECFDPSNVCWATITKSPPHECRARLWHFL